MNLTSKALNDVTNAEVLLRIKGIVALFIQTMEVGNQVHTCIFYLADIVIGLWIPCFCSGDVYAHAV